MRSARQFIFEEMGIQMPEGNISGEWFAENHLPMIVKCAYCETSMALPSALVDNDGTIYCHNCAGE